nr:hypothetical protein BgiMline_027698 [Biomphalaria glabrata]
MRRYSTWCLLLFLLCCCLLLTSILLPRDSYLKIQVTESPRREKSVHYFIPGRYDDIYMYSAIADDPKTLHAGSAVDVVVTALDKTRVSLTCCMLLDGDNGTVFVTPASVYFRNYITLRSFTHIASEYFHPSTYLARQYRCTSQSRPRYVTLTSSACPDSINDYLPVTYPNVSPRGLALCAKVARSPDLNVQKLAEWFEVQRHLGVDKIVVYNLGVDNAIGAIFRYYQNLGLLELLAYELPGEPRSRNLNEVFKRTRQFVQDESVPVLDCKLRMSGYDFVLSHDLDEMVIPRENIPLKRLLKESLATYPNAAGFYLYTSFFLLDWTATNPKQKLIVKAYRTSTVPRWEAIKFVFIPERTRTILTHEIFPRPKYDTAILSPDDVILHHYRKCPRDTWGTCTAATVVDDVMMRFRDLDSQVTQVLERTLKIKQF